MVFLSEYYARRSKLSQFYLDLGSMDTFNYRPLPVPLSLLPTLLLLLLLLLLPILGKLLLEGYCVIAAH